MVGRLNDTNVWGVNGGLDAETTDYTAKLATSLQSSPREVKPAEFLDHSIVGKAMAEARKM